MQREREKSIDCRAERNEECGLSRVMHVCCVCVMCGGELRGGMENRICRCAAARPFDGTDFATDRMNIRGESVALTMGGN